MKLEWMNKITARWQAFRTWQENPISYHMDTSEHVCNNCGHTFRGNYCPVCSQSARQGRVSWLAIWQGIGQLWGFESRSAIFTLWQLFLRPGYLVRDYISGKRQVSYPPVKLLFILAAVVALARYFFPIPVPEHSLSGYKYVDWAIMWIDSHQNIAELLIGCAAILPTWILFRKAPRYPNHTIPEGFYLQVYLAILSYIITSFFAELDGIASALTVAYSFMAYKQLFGYGYWGTLWRLTICAILSLTILIMIALIGAVVSVI